MVTNTFTQQTRNLVAVNGDIAGFSRHMADDPESMANLMQAYHRLVEDRVAKSNGVLVSFVGDNFMALFEEPTDAIRAAIAISTGVEEHNDERPERNRVRFRIGIDQGLVTDRDGQYLGESLNIAARIQELATPGGISVSGKVFRALDEPALRFRFTGQHPLRNIPGQVDVFQFVDLPSHPHDGDIHARLSLSLPSIVVLPIHTVGTTAETASAAGVIRSDLLHTLSALPQLTVIDADLHREIEPGTAQYLLQTGVHQSGDELRVYAKVMFLASMNIVTSHRWATTVDELFSLAETISDEVAKAVGVEIVIGEQARLYEGIDDPEALRKIYTGWFYLTADNPEDWRRSVELFDEVAEAHPQEGHALASFAKWVGASEGYTDDPEALYREAFEEASLIIGMGDPTGLAHMVQGAVFMDQGQATQALDVIEKAEITRPTCDVTYALEASVRRYMGHWEKSVDLMDTAIRLAAVPPAWYPTVQAVSLFMGGRLDLAAALAEEVIEHHPGSLEALMVLVAAQAEQGLTRRAQATAEMIRDRFPGEDFQEWLESNPFIDRSVVERWHSDLVAVGLVPTV